MDERVKEVYRKIYAELFLLIMIGCAISIMVKFAVLGMDASDCIPEYPILIGSPLYLAVRTRMLGVTQAGNSLSSSARNKRSGLTAGILVAVFLFAATLRSQTGSVDWKEVGVFGICFIVVFLAAQRGFQHLEDKRQKKLDSRYDD